MLECIHALDFFHLIAVELQDHLIKMYESQSKQSKRTCKELIQAPVPCSKVVVVFRDLLNQ